MATADTEARTRTPEEVGRSYFEAVSARDAQAMADHWHADGVEDIAPVGIFRGPAEVKGFFDELFGAVPDMETVVEQVVSEGQTVVVKYRSTGRFTGTPLQGLDPTGGLIELRGVDVIEVREGKIERNSAYFDGMALARGIGVLPPQDSGVEKALYGAFNAVTKVRAAVRDHTGG
ncbi:MAG: ester cyclase [Thermoleophilaceae bacterium]